MLSKLKGPWLFVSVLWFGIGSNFSNISRQPAANTRSSDQIALVTRVDEHLSRDRLPARGLDRHHARPVFLPSLRPVEPLVAMQGNGELLHIIVEHLLRRVRLEDPHCPLRAIDRRRA